MSQYCFYYPDLLIKNCKYDVKIKTPQSEPEEQLFSYVSQDPNNP